MKIASRLVLFAAFTALAVWLWTVLFPSPEKIIRKQLAEVARCASFVANEGPLARAGNVAKLAGYFSADAQLSFDVPGHGPHALTGRDEIIQAAMGARSAVGALVVEFPDVNVTLATDKQSATVDLTAKAKIPGERDFYVQEMKFTLKKKDGDWLIIRVETVKTLSRSRAGEAGRVTPCAPP
ncbi:MAG: nuclear transport factor 2 family protein, partial [Verrucomicrobia bacterium]|nr:nuclear transport factor 2 family protein [Verrucomicrobiota bacterium]